MSSPAAKRQRTEPAYNLLYHDSIPGRGEFIRLAFEAAGVSYTEAARAGSINDVYAACAADSLGTEGNPPAFAPPMLKVPGAGKDGKTLLISQTPNILLYLGKALDLAGGDEIEYYYVNELALTALDLSNETHDSHHPIAGMEYYEDQKEESLRRATDFRKNRIPKFFGYFERALKGNEENGQAKYLVGNKLSYADTTLWQVIDGLLFAFPKELEARKEDYPLLFQTFYPGIKEEKGIKSYLESDRRFKYSQGIFRHYPELDRQ